MNESAKSEVVLVEPAAARPGDLVTVYGYNDGTPALPASGVGVPFRVAHVELPFVVLRVAAGDGVAVMDVRRAVLMRVSEAYAAAVAGAEPAAEAEPGEPTHLPFGFASARRAA